MISYTIDNWMVAWVPSKPEKVKVGPWPDTIGWTDAAFLGFHPWTAGCCNAWRHGKSLDHRILMAFVDFHTLVVRDGIDPITAHREFSKIREYREIISPDIDGAR